MAGMVCITPASYFDRSLVSWWLEWSVWLLLFFYITPATYFVGSSLDGWNVLYHTTPYLDKSMVSWWLEWSISPYFNRSKVNQWLEWSVSQQLHILIGPSSLDGWNGLYHTTSYFYISRQLHIFIGPLSLQWKGLYHTAPYFDRSIITRWLEWSVSHHFISW